MIMPLLTVKDVDESVAFFTDKLGFDLRMTMAPEGKNVFGIVNFGGSDFGLGLDMDHIPEGVAYAPGVEFMIYLPEGQSIDSYYSDVQAKGIKIDQVLADTYWGDRAFTLHDPNGYTLTFCVTIKQVPVEQMEASVRDQQAMK